MIDCHCHILPGIDDGAQTMEDSLRLARQSAEDGVTCILTTPHGSSRELVTQLDRRDCALQQLRGRLKQEHLELVLVPGLEYFADDRLTESGVEVSRCRCGEEGGTGLRPLLFELSMDMDINLLDSILFSAQLKHLPLVLAHPERYHGFARHVDYFAELQNRGLYLQFNSEDFQSRLFHPSPAREMLKLIAHDPEHALIGSDAHHPVYRPAGLRIGRERILKTLGAEVWTMISDTVPRRLLGL